MPVINVGERNVSVYSGRWEVVDDNGCVIGIATVSGRNVAFITPQGKTRLLMK